MKSYPSIPPGINRELEVYAFDKLDGSNIRAEWSRKRKEFYKFGSRTQLLGEDDKTLGPARKLIQDKYGDSISRILSEMRVESAVCFFEFFGPSSFAGTHADEPHDVVLFDVDVFKRGLLDPVEFSTHFVGVLDTPRLVYQGLITQDVEEQIRSGQMPGVTFEGVVCKSETRKQGLQMFKVKTRQWLDRLKSVCGADEKLFQKLA